MSIQYKTFEDLRLYCYRVASVVGLVCIHVFGYRNPEAEPLAERCGLAFQLTNIIRDVKEDASMAGFICRKKIWRSSICPPRNFSRHQIPRASAPACFRSRPRP